MQTLLLLGLVLANTWMAAIGWYVGLVHYPGFRRVDPGQWRDYHAHHSAATGVLVCGPMLAQFVLTLAICTTGWNELASWVLVGMALCLIFSFGWTMIVSGPLHGPLTSSKDFAVIDRLVATNWPRAVAWTLQALLSAWLLIAPVLKQKQF